MNNSRSITLFQEDTLTRVLCLEYEDVCVPKLYSLDRHSLRSVSCYILESALGYTKLPQAIKEAALTTGNLKQITEEQTQFSLPVGDEHHKGARCHCVSCYNVDPSVLAI